MRFEKRLLSTLNPAAYNPRVSLTPNDKEYQELKASIEKFDYADPIVINEDGTIIKGHQRRTVMMDMGYTEVGVIVLDIPNKSDEKALNMALNKLTGRWDEEKLKQVLLDLNLEGYDFSVTGFRQDDLSDLIDRIDIPDQASDDLFDEEAASNAITEPSVQTGDIYQLGRHRLMCGDSTSKADVAKLMGGRTLDLVVTDPPYNVDYGAKVDSMKRKGVACKQKRANDHIENDHMDRADFYAFLLSAFRCTYNVMRPGAAIYVFHSEFCGTQFRKAFTDAGLRLAQCLIWEKNAFVLGRQDYQWRHEPILYGWKEGAAHYFVNDRTQDTILPDDLLELQNMKKQELLSLIETILHTYKDQTTVLYENKPSHSELHPTMKPVPLVGSLIHNSSKPGWTVGDFFGGSGSTLIAAEQLGRTAFIMEKDRRNVEVIVKRWETYTGLSAERLT